MQNAENIRRNNPLTESCGFAAICPRKCNCDLSRRVQCYRVGQMPKEIASTTKRLYISHSKIKQLQISDVSRLPALEEFVLTCSGTESVERNTFKALDDLRILELWKNKLRHVPVLLPATLEVLKLGDNLISVLNESDFEGLKKLRVLDIQNNLILALSSSTLSSLCSLQRLTLAGNNMESVSGGPLTLLNLKYLSMENNKLQSFPESFFTVLHMLLFLNLNGNLLTKTPPGLPKSLLSLTLERNQLKILRSEDMKQLTNLSELCMSENQLSSIDGAQFLSSLTRLELAGNKLRTIPVNLPATLQKIDCSNNLIEKIETQDFHDLQDLKHLFLDNNVVNTFEDGALQRCTVLSNLALEQNLLRSIPLSLPHTLARLDLKGNSIQKIQEQELKNLRQLQVLNLRNNKITALDHGLLKHLPRLRYLYLEGNPWNCTCDLFRTRRALAAQGTEVQGGQCSAPAESKGETWMSSKRILRLCIRDSLYSSEEGKAIQRKTNANHPSSLRVDMDDYYDYETD
ncbi:nephrocan-like isoform X2 [Eublepharis macularius]|uniref:Nephrocan-like isoform X2 n=1 Tax=Eublepharis macularius TaxID=481883 RepID=A0AA97L5A6_EUBMA|nr:nephrocan-like isoform X2 [Eublepharis macularius]